MEPIDLIGPIASLIIAIISFYYHSRTYGLSLKERQRAYFVELSQKKVAPIRDEILKRVDITKDGFLLDVMNRSSRNLKLDSVIIDSNLYYELERRFRIELDKDRLEKDFYDYLNKYNGLMEESERFQKEHKELMIVLFKSLESVRNNMDSKWDYSRDLYPEWLDSQKRGMAIGSWKKLNEKAGKDVYEEVTQDKEGVKRVKVLEELIGGKYESCMECLGNMDAIVLYLHNRIIKENNLTASESISQENIRWG